MIVLVCPLNRCLFRQHSALLGLFARKPVGSSSGLGVSAPRYSEALLVLDSVLAHVNTRMPKLKAREEHLAELVEKKQADFLKKNKQRHGGSGLPYTESQIETIKYLSDYATSAQTLPIRHDKLVQQLTLSIFDTYWGAGAPLTVLQSQVLTLLIDVYDILRKPATELLHFRLGPITDIADIPVFTCAVDSKLIAADMRVITQYVIESVRRCFRIGAAVVGVCFDGSSKCTWAREGTDHVTHNRTWTGVLQSAKAAAKVSKDAAVASLPPGSVQTNVAKQEVKAQLANETICRMPPICSLEQMFVLVSQNQHCGL